jgi:hypothetical protein
VTSVVSSVARKLAAGMAYAFPKMRKRREVGYVTPATTVRLPRGSVSHFSIRNSDLWSSPTPTGPSIVFVSPHDSSEKRLCIQAYEESVEGYEFELHGHALDDPLEGFQELLGKMHRALARRHLVYEKGSRYISVDNIVRGRIAWDDQSSGSIPRLVIDGKPVTWHEFGGC